jgi:hypothetical protein
MERVGLRAGTAALVAALAGAMLLTPVGAIDGLGQVDSAGAAAAVSATVPVVRCPTTFASTAPTTTAPVPTKLTVPLSAAAAAQVAAYTDMDGTFVVFGPRGWNCKALFGADGSGGIEVIPPGEVVHVDPGQRWHLQKGSVIQAIVGFTTGGSPVQAASVACPLFRNAQTAANQGLGSCGFKRPAKEVVTHVGTEEVKFVDPPGVTGDGAPSGGKDAADGVMFYIASKTNPQAAAVTCTATRSEQSVCRSVLTLTEYGFHHVRQ